MRDALLNRTELLRWVIVGNLSPGWTMIRIIADPDERVALAHRFSLVALEQLDAKVCLRPMARTTVRVKGSLQTEVV